MKRNSNTNMQRIKTELTSDKKKIFQVSWVNRNKENKTAYVRIAGFAYDSAGRPIVVVRSVEHKNMLFNLRIASIYDMKPISARKLRAM